MATGNDVDTIVDMYRCALDEMGSPYKEDLLLNKVIISLNLAPCFLLINDGIIQGMAGLTIVVSSPSGQATLTDYMFYIKPEHRKLKNFSELINATKDFAVEKNLPLNLQFANDIDEKVRKRLFSMHGFKIISVIGGFNE